MIFRVTLILTGLHISESAPRACPMGTAGIKKQPRPYVVNTLTVPEFEYL